jgi:hypothetical protein
MTIGIVQGRKIGIYKMHRSDVIASVGQGLYGFPDAKHSYLQPIFKRFDALCAGRGLLNGATVAAETEMQEVVARLVGNRELGEALLRNQRATTRKPEILDPNERVLAKSIAAIDIVRELSDQNVMDINRGSIRELDRGRMEAAVASVFSQIPDGSIRKEYEGAITYKLVSNAIPPDLWDKFATAVLSAAYGLS